MEGISCLQTIIHVVKKLIRLPMDGMSCLAQAQWKMMDIPLQRTVNVQS